MDDVRLHSTIFRQRSTPSDDIPTTFDSIRRHSDNIRLHLTTFRQRSTPSDSIRRHSNYIRLHLTTFRLLSTPSDDIPTTLDSIRRHSDYIRLHPTLFRQRSKISRLFSSYSSSTVGLCRDLSNFVGISLSGKFNNPIKK